MFTGIIEEIGTIKNINQISERSIELTIKANIVLSDINVGDSIAVNGICLTVKQFSEFDFTVDVMPETVKATSLRKMDVGMNVNLERSLQFNSRLGGHFVTGHVDAVGKIVAKKHVENAIYYDIVVPSEYMIYFVMKGSIAVDGISLTIFDVKEQTVTISLIPHTLNVTILGEKEIGDVVNIECDMLAKLVHAQIKNYVSMIHKKDV